MKKLFTHKFVEFIPQQLDENVLYISIECVVAVHLCACGCRSKIVTPISPFNWQLKFDGEKVSLSPSIGNWNFPCHSHYWIRDNYFVFIDDQLHYVDLQSNKKKRKKKKKYLSFFSKFIKKKK